MMEGAAGPLAVISGLQCRLPLIVGVTGHRDLRAENIGALEREVREAFSRIKRDYLGAGGDTPLIVMSSLAEGADQLAARVALEMGAGLISPLPLPTEEYRSDFSSGAGAEFERLLGLALAAPVMPLVDGNSLEDIRNDPSRRALQYKEAGLFILRRCHILLALWDGETRDAKPGGTAQIVALRKSGVLLDSGSSVRDCMDSTGAGPLIVIATPRQSANGKPFAVRTLPWGRELASSQAGQDSQTKAWRDFGAQMRLTTDYNRDAALLLSSKAGDAKFRQGLIQLMEAPRPTKATQARSLILHAAPVLCATYTVADLLARHYQNRFKAIWRSLFVLAFLMAVALGLPSVQSVSKTYGLIIYQLLFFCSFALYVFARRRQYQARYLDYRALSEAARVGVFWKVAGIKQSVADAYPLCQALELSWVRTSLKSLECFQEKGAEPDAGMDALRYGLCHDVWVRGQAEYYRKRGEHHARLAKRSKALAVGFVAFAGAGTFLIGASQYFSIDWKSRVPLGAAAYVPLFLELLPAGAAAIQGYAEQLGRTAQAMQFERMRALYDRALEILPDAVDERQQQKIQEVFKELGRESMQEAASWTSIFRLRPLKPV